MNFSGGNKWLVFVLPGFIALFVAGFISDLPEIPDAHLPIIYAALTKLSTIIPLSVVHTYGVITKKSLEIGSIIYSKYIVASIFICAIFIGLLFGVAHSTDYLSEKLRSVFGETAILKSSQLELLYVMLKNAYNKKFVDAQPHVSNKDTNRYVRIIMPGNLKSYEGVVTQFSVGASERQIYLSPDCEVDGNTAELIHGPGVWLDVKNYNEIQFFYSVCSICAKQVEIAAGLKADFVCPFK